MVSDEFGDLVTRYWQAEAAGRSPERSERLRVRSPDGDLYFIEDEVSDVMLDRERGDRFMLAALQSSARPDDDWVVAWLGGMTIEAAISGGDIHILDRLVVKGMDQGLATRIRTFID